jgi:hypothetical protein
MSQHDLSIADQSAPLFRADLNNALAALGSLQSGGTAPALPYNSLLWYDTATDILKIGNEAGDAFYPVGYMNSSAGSFDVVDGTKVSTTAGVVVGSLSAQSEATWVAGVGTTETLISPAKLAAAVLPAVSGLYGTVLARESSGLATVTLTAADTVTFTRGFTTSVVGLSTSYTMTNYTGVVRAKATLQGGNQSGEGSSSVRLYLNGALLQTFSAAPGATTLCSRDVTFSNGDIIKWTRVDSSAGVTSYFTANDGYVSLPAAILASDL